MRNSQILIEYFFIDMWKNGKLTKSIHSHGSDAKPAFCFMIIILSINWQNTNQLTQYFIQY
ncbi:MAG: hypothetical protein J6T06_06960, partial [Victivallales bacterium]|nr:hypothetical protein [Victivallales bacterium]